MRTIDELTNEELRKVYDKNTRLQGMVMDDMADSEMFWIEEHLEYLRDSLSSWSIGQFNRNQHLRVGDASEFIYAYERLHKDMQPLPEKYSKMVERAVETADEYRYTDVNTDEFDELEEEVELVANEIAYALERLYTEALDDYCLDDDNAKEYFIEFYVEERMDSSYYVNEEYKLFKDVAYTVDFTKAFA